MLRSLLDDGHQGGEVVKLCLLCHALLRYPSVHDEPPVTQEVEDRGEVARIPVYQVGPALVLCGNIRLVIQHMYNMHTHPTHVQYAYSTNTIITIMN